MKKFKTKLPKLSIKLKIKLSKQVFGFYAALTIAYLIWGANFVVAKVTLQEVPVMTLGFLRFSLACLLLMPFLWAEKKQLKVSSTDIPRLFTIGVLMITFHIYLFYTGLSKTSAINTSILSLLTPLFSLLGGWLFLKEKIYWINLLGSGLGLVGALVIIGLPLLFTEGFNAESFVGNSLLVASSIVFVMGAILAKPLLKSYHYLVITSCSFLVGAVTFAIPAILEFLQNPDWIYRVSIYGVLGLLYITVLSTISAFFLYYWAFEKVGLAKSSLFNYLNPVVAASLAVPFLGERISFSFIIGTCLVILGVYWGTFGKEKHHHHLLQHHR